MMLSLNLPFGKRRGRSGGCFRAEIAFIPDRARWARSSTIDHALCRDGPEKGTHTAIPMLIAEELEVDLEAECAAEHAPHNEKLYANPLLGVQATGNARTARNPRARWQPLRQAGATARTMLVAVAAKKWNVDPTSCRAQSAEVLHSPSGRRIRSYGALDAGAARMSVPENVVLEQPRGILKQLSWHPGEASRYAGKGQRNGGLWHRRTAAPA